MSTRANVRGMPFVAVFSMGMALQAAADVTLYEHDDFRGRSFRATRDIQNLDDERFNDTASSIEVHGGSWEICADSDFRGRCVTLEPGDYRSLGEMGLNDRVSSIRAAHGSYSGHGGGRGGLTLYEDDNFRGRDFRAGGVVVDLNQGGFNDKASSAEVHGGSWEVCTDADFRGRCVTLDAGSYPSMRQMGLNDSISSVRPARGGYSSHSSNYSSGGGTPEVKVNRNGSYTVLYPGTSCMATYNPQGRRTSALNACDGGQLGRADAAVAAQRREQGMDHSNADHSGAGYGAPPEIMVGSNGEGEVIFGNKCVVYYNASGRRTKNLPACSRDQTRHADDAMARYRREQGL